MDPEKRKGIESGGSQPGGLRLSRFELVSIFILICSISIVFHDVTSFGFIPLDDGLYVTDNPYIQGGLTTEGVLWAITSFKGTMWIPLTWVSLMVDCELYGLNPGGYHLTNLLFHMGCSVLLFLFFSRSLGLGWHGLFIAFIFAIHPLRVESVVWITERKDVLSGFFWMAAMLSYSYYVRSPNVLRYLPLLAFFILGLMSKAIVVTFPFVLLLLDVWPFDRFRKAAEEPGSAGNGHKIGIDRQRAMKLVAEKVPLFVCAFIATFIGFLALSEQEVAVGDIVPLKIRIANAAVSYVVYVRKMFVPNDLSVFYPMNIDDYSFGNTAGAFLLILGVSVLCVFAFRKYRFFAVGWFWYLGTLVPVIGLRQLGYNSMADRFTYIPHIGISIIVVVGIAKLMASVRRSYVIIAPATLFLAGCLLFSTYFQVGYWKDPVMLFEQAIENTSKNFMAHNSLGDVLLEKGDYDKAIRHFLTSLRIKKNSPRTYVNLGLAYFQKGEYAKAADSYKKAIVLDPDQTEAYLNLGNMLLAQGKTNEAIDIYAEVIRKNPKTSKAYNNLGLALLRKGAVDGAVDNFYKALTQQPRNKNAKTNYLIAKKYRKQITEAVLRIREFLTKSEGKDLSREDYQRLFLLKAKLDETINSLIKGISTQKGFDESEFDIQNIPDVHEIMDRYEEKMKQKRAQKRKRP